MHIDENSLPLVSVIIPSYNHQNFVQHTIKSVLDQDHENIELIIIDDGSSDNSVEKIKEVVKDCERRFKRFEFRSRANEGLCATLNEALKWCKGEYLSIVASDDILLSDKTSKQIKLFSEPKNSNIAVISGGMISINSSGKVDKHSGFVSPKYGYHGFLDIYRGNSGINAPTAMIRMYCIKEVGGYDTNVITEDFYMWLAITKLGYSILVVNDIYTQYRIHDNNTFSKIRMMHKSTKNIRKIFMPNEAEYILAIKNSDLKAFKAAAVYDKGYALCLLLSGKVKSVSKSVLFYGVVLFIPKSLFFLILKKYRIFKK